MSELTYVVLDFETTGLDYKKEQVTEIGAVKLNSKLEEVGSFHTFVKLHSGNQLSTYTKITQEMVDTGLEEAQAMFSLETFIGESIVVAQWAPFDLAFLSKFDINPESFICTKSLTSQMEPNESSSLGPTCERMGISLENAHRALDDAKATAEVLKYHFVTNNVLDNIHVHNTLTVTPGRPMSFLPKHTELVIDKSTGEILIDFREAI